MKPVHRAALIGPNGDVSALCSAKPRAIDPKKASWTNRDEAVTCSRCKAAIEHGREADAIAPEAAAEVQRMERNLARERNWRAAGCPPGEIGEAFDDSNDIDP
jgi:hypothetical protein